MAQQRRPAGSGPRTSGSVTHRRPRSDFSRTRHGVGRSNPVAGPTTAADGPGRSPSGRPPARRIRAPRAPKAISGRAAALGLLLAALTLAYAFPVRVYLAQQAEIDQLRAAQEAQRNRIASLQAQIARWDDPNYVITQARVRLSLVRRGEMLFVVQADPLPSDPPPASSGRSWLGTLWSNVQGADNPEGS